MWNEEVTGALEGLRGLGLIPRKLGGPDPVRVLGYSLSRNAWNWYSKEELGSMRPIREVNVAVERGKEDEVPREGVLPEVSQTQG